MESVNDNDRKNLLDVVYEASEHPDNDGPDKEERGVDLDLMDQRSGGLVFPNHVKVRFKAAKRKDERDEKTAGTDHPEFCDGNVFGVFHNVHDLFCRPVEIEHVNHDGEVVRNEVSEPDCKRNRCEHDEQGDDCD